MNFRGARFHAKGDYISGPAECFIQAVDFPEKTIS